MRQQRHNAAASKHYHKAHLADMHAIAHIRQLTLRASQTGSTQLALIVLTSGRRWLAQSSVGQSIHVCGPARTRIPERARTHTHTRDLFVDYTGRARSLEQFSRIAGHLEMKMMMMMMLIKRERTWNERISCASSVCNHHTSIAAAATTTTPFAEPAGSSHQVSLDCVTRRT